MPRPRSRPLRSAKRTVTCLRSPSMAAREVRIFSAKCLGMYDSGLAERPAGSAVSAAPQDRQNFLPGVTTVPQLGQTASSRAPQSSQKRAPASFSAWHREHFMPEPPSILGEGRNGGPRVTARVSGGQGHYADRTLRRPLGVGARRTRSGSWPAARSDRARSCAWRPSNRRSPGAVNPRACRPGSRFRSPRGCDRRGSGS